MLLFIWNLLRKWGITSLGKGYYYFYFFFLLEDSQQVRSIGSWYLNLGFLKLFAWTKDFNPYVQPYTSAQVMINFFGLAQEYWRPKILFAIRSIVITSIWVDQLTNKSIFDRDFRHFVRVLVDVELRKFGGYHVLVERSGFSFLLT